MRIRILMPDKREVDILCLPDLPNWWLVTINGPTAGSDKKG
jgi:hypothetical protein